MTGILSSDKISFVDKLTARTILLNLNNISIIRVDNIDDLGVHLWIILSHGDFFKFVVSTEAYDAIYNRFQRI